MVRPVGNNNNNNGPPPRPCRFRTVARIFMGALLVAVLYRERQSPRKLASLPSTSTQQLNTPGTGSTSTMIVQKKPRPLDAGRGTEHDVASLAKVAIKPFSERNANKGNPIDKDMAEPSTVRATTTHDDSSQHTGTVATQPASKNNGKNKETDTDKGHVKPPTDKTTVAAPPKRTPAIVSKEKRRQFQARLKAMKQTTKQQQQVVQETKSQLLNHGNATHVVPAFRQPLHKKKRDSLRAWDKIQTYTAAHADVVTHHKLPPLDTLIGDFDQNITGDVQWLLDFAIVGFGKCGTTTLIQWLDAHPETNTIPKEALALSRNKPASLVKRLYEMKLETMALDQAKKNATAPTTTKILQGFKNPSDIRRPQAMSYLREYWPSTKLIVTVRHPVHWFRSLYNFLVNEMKRSPKFLHHNSLVGGPHRDTAYAHTGKGEFHAILALLGKTNMTLPAELQLLQGYLREDELEDWPQPLPNQIFFLETRQMSDANETRATQFRADLQAFLGLSQPLPPMLHIRPGHHREVSEHVKMDVCARENMHVRKDLMRISRAASQWMREFFIQSPDVVVSSRDYLEELLVEWMDDPCGPVFDHTDEAQDVERK